MVGRSMFTVLLSLLSKHAAILPPLERTARNGKRDVDFQRRSLGVESFNTLPSAKHRTYFGIVVACTAGVNSKYEGLIAKTEEQTR